MSEGVGERRSARVGTVSGLALLVGGTAVAAVAGGAHSIFATILLGLLTVGMGHALLEEIRRQAHRVAPTWAVQDMINAGLLATLAVGAVITAVLPVVDSPVRAVCLLLTLGYALSLSYFIVGRRRVIAELSSSPAGRPGAVPDEEHPVPGTAQPVPIREVEEHSPMPESAPRLPN